VFLAICVLQVGNAFYIILHVIIPVYYMYMYLSMYLHCTLHWDNICIIMYLAYIHCGRSVVFVFVIEDSV
jgi:hypothetical protein